MTRSVAVVGLGYVGLPLATAFSRHLPTVGFDVDASRIAELQKGHDRNGETSPDELASPGLTLTTDVSRLAAADVLVVAVPTPVDADKRPDLRHLLSASRTVGAALRARAPGAPVPVVVFESTVYPGCTEEVCIPEIAKVSGLAPGVGFRYGYSPERMNPGDKAHGLADVVKVVAGQDPATTETLAQLYGRVVRAGVHRAPDVRTAEAAKVIENTQRDLNIALMNELAVLFHRAGIDMGDVLAAAGTKWNFLPFSPGLVGGHCIPEDPYYLTFKAQELGHDPQVILAGRRVNDAMGRFVAEEALRLLADRGTPRARVLVLGAAFKENVRDTRNTRVVDVVRVLEAAGVDVRVHDPVVGADGLRALGVQIEGAMPPGEPCDVVILAVPHRAFLELPVDALVAAASRGGRPGVVMDVRRRLDREAIRRAGATYWAL